MSQDDQTAGPGHNQAPEGDPFALSLEEKNQDLWRMFGALEMRRLKLPKEPTTEEEAGQITEWSADARSLTREFERRRVEVKEPYLRRGQLIDDTFNGPKKALATKADEIERRNGPYLRAKKEREEAERREQARIAREKQEAAERAAAEERRKLREAQDAREKAEREAREAEQRRVRQEEEDRQRREREERERAAADGMKLPDPERPAPAVDALEFGSPPTAEANQESMRQANVDEQAAAKRVEEAEAEARKAGLAAGRAEKRADQTGQLGKVTAGGANQRAEMIWVARIDSYPKMMQSLGPIGPFLSEQIVRDAVARAAKHPSRPDIPGISYQQELDVKTTAKRS